MKLFLIKELRLIPKFLTKSLTYYYKTKSEFEPKTKQKMHTQLSVLNFTVSNLPSSKYRSIKFAPIVNRPKKGLARPENNKNSLT